MADPFLLLILGEGQQEHVPRRGHIVVYFAWSDDLLLLVEVVFVALYMAAAALDGGRRLEDVPQRFGAGLAVGGEVVERGDELMAFVGEAVSLVPWSDRVPVRRVFPDLALVGIKDLEYSGDLIRFRSVHVSLCHWSDVKQFIYI